MIVHKNLANFEAERNFVITLGNFDGVHLGHQEILQTVDEIASKYSLLKGIFTFHPHPMRHFGAEISLINTRRKKHEIFRSMKIDHLFELPFDQTFADIDPEVFIREFLVKKLRARYIIVGYDYHFGKGRKGNYDLLKHLEHKYGYTALRVPRKEIHGETVSSSLIRRLVSEGDVAEAAIMMGRPFCVEGTVVRGDGIGKQIGCPTANIMIENELIPADGVYATRTFIGGRQFLSSTYVGYRPTVQGEKELRIETHILDFDEDIYDQFINVEFVDRVRGDMAFPNFDALMDQITRDLDASRDILEKNT